MGICFYEVKAEYVAYLSSYEPRLFHNRKEGQSNERKYIGVVLQVNDFDYFAPLSSFKPKHECMRNGLDFIKIRKYAVINLNNMFPVPVSERSYVDFNRVNDQKYKALLIAEYRAIKPIQDKILKNASALYKHKLAHGNDSWLPKVKKTRRSIVRLKNETLSRPLPKEMLSQNFPISLWEFRTSNADRSSRDLSFC